MDDSARQMRSVGAVLFLEGAYLRPNLLERDVITASGVGLCETVHDGPKGLARLSSFLVVVVVYVKDEKEGEMVDGSKESVEK